MHHLINCFDYCYLCAAAATMITTLTVFSKQTVGATSDERSSTDKVADQLFSGQTVDRSSSPYFSDAASYVLDHQPPQQQQPSVVEVCQWEVFDASCPDPGQIVLIESARYGRMHFSRCVREDHGNLGCAADVRPHLDRICSGRSRCLLPIPDAELHAAHPCPRELMPYLEASYSCLDVKAGSEESCSLYNGSPLMKTSGYLSSVSVVDNSLIGTSSCPWLIEAPQGQRINLTLFDFKVGPQSVASQRRGCREYGWIVVVREYNVSVEIPGCGVLSTVSRQRVVYVSRSSKISVHLEHRSAAALSSADTELNDDDHILLQYQVYGCADIVSVPEAYVQRIGDTTVVTCHNNEMSSLLLTCSDGRWTSSGDDSNAINCSSMTVKSTTVTSLHRHLQTSNVQTQSYGLAIVIGSGISCGIILGILLLLSTLACVKRRRRLRNQLKNTETIDQLFRQVADDFDNELRYPIESPNAMTSSLSAMYSQQSNRINEEDPLSTPEMHIQQTRMSLLREPLHYYDSSDPYRQSDLCPFHRSLMQLQHYPNHGLWHRQQHQKQKPTISTVLPSPVQFHHQILSSLSSSSSAAAGVAVGDLTVSTPHLQQSERRQVCSSDSAFPAELRISPTSAHD